MAVTLSDKAATHIGNFIAKRGKGVGIRLGVRTSGCSGMAYKLVFVDEPKEEDEVFESHGARIYVDPKSLAWLQGTVIDFVQAGDDSGFSFRNPNVSSQCGCGESFYV